jgi:hypothetical protein
MAKFFTGCNRMMVMGAWVAWSWQSSDGGGRIFYFDKFTWGKLIVAYCHGTVFKTRPSDPMRDGIGVIKNSLAF